MSVFLLNEASDVEVDSPGAIGVQASMVTEASQSLSQFWPRVTDEIRKIDQLEVRVQALPLARIKKIMKLDEDVKMISAEAPVLFAKAAELFIEELTLRAWVHTEDNKRRTLQRNDIAMAITKYDQFDFLIDIVPRDEVKPAGGGTRTGGGSGGGGGGGAAENAPRAAINADQVHYYFQLAQQHQAALSTGQSGSAGSSPSHVAAASQVVAQDHHAVAKPNILREQTPTVSTNASANNSGGGIQLVQQIVAPSGEVQHVPIQLSASQLAMIKMQLQNNSGQPIIIQTTPVQAQPQLIQVAQAGTGATPLFVQNQGSGNSPVATESD